MTNKEKSILELIKKELSFTLDPQIDMTGTVPKQIKDFEHKVILSYPLKRHLSISGLNLCFDEERNGIERSFSILSDSKKIEWLEISITSSFNLLDEDFLMLKKSLNKLPLKALHINFLDLCLNDLQIKYLAEGTASLSYLQEFTMSLSWSNIKPKMLGFITKRIGNLQKLNKVDLGFQSCLNITDGSIYTLASSIHKLPLLRTVILRLKVCQSISSEGVKKIKSLFEGLPSLKLMRIDFP